ncbi:MAG: undecaprenyl-diphosphate phosphatase [Clostridia bacterium]|nr:undecaprenyl-diphosphate phosphatase [Clostridia bacterium]
MSVLEGALLGLVQGLAEFLPISSSGHLLLGKLLLGIDTEASAFKVLEILLHVGTLIPVLIVFWRDWIDMICHPIRNHTLALLFLASLPALAAYVIFDMDVFDSGWFLGVSCLITAVLLLLTDVVSRHRRVARQKVGWLNALCMGLMQALGLLPGVSRSGSTISGGVFSGLERKEAARFSFMMSAPAIAGSLLMEGKHALEEGLFSQLELVPTVVGVLVAAVSGYLAIRFMLRLITKVPLSWFALYMALLGLCFLLLQLAGSPLVPAFELPSLADLIKLSL